MRVSPFTQHAHSNVFPSLSIQQFASPLHMPSNNSTASEKDASISGIAELRVHADQLSPIPSVYKAAFSRPNLLSQSPCILWSDIPAYRREAAVIELQFTIGWPLVRNALLRSDLYATLPRCAEKNKSWDQL